MSFGPLVRLMDGADTLRPEATNRCWCRLEVDLMARPDQSPAPASAAPDEAAFTTSLTNSRSANRRELLVHCYRIWGRSMIEDAVHGRCYDPGATARPSCDLPCAVALPSRTRLLDVSPLRASPALP